MTEPAAPLTQHRAAPRRRRQAQLGLAAAADAAAPAAARWPLLGELGLTPAQQAWRRAGIGGSDASIILSGDPDRIVALWREKRGEAEGEDLSRVLPVMLGQWTEAFNRQWYQRQTGNAVADAGAQFACPLHDWRRCTLDGFIYAMGAIWEAKHTSAFGKPDEVLARYMPQFASRLTGATRPTDATSKLRLFPGRSRIRTKRSKSEQTLHFALMAIS